MSGAVTVRDNGASDLMKRVRALSEGKRVRVGILADKPKHDVKGSTSKRARVQRKVASRATKTLLEVAIIHEFGAGHVPARSFIRATIDEKRAEIQALQVVVAKQVLAGKLTPDQALGQIGAKVAAMIQQRIRDGLAPPLAASTLRRKKNKSTPLILTGQLRSSVTWALAN